ncbi:hypothetical protein [Daejeonella sp. H1SJ63]|uniref:hypothetical protein n=1 Tax=Daejeonella sp. H1SJ63 TaxID=3034145 RepID=UPI0023ED9547|nr:hypothetical protein [Daejeonella sp. H1SJ63]
MNKILIIGLLLFTSNVFSQNLKLGKHEFEIKNVKASVTELKGEKVIKVERDLNLLPFDLNRLESTVDEPTFAELKNVSFENGIIEVKMLSQIQDPSPFKGAQGFIGVAFRVTDNEKEYESFYLRPKVGRSDNQGFRNKTVQYYSYPNYKFDTLRKLTPGIYETTAPVDINEWIKIKIVVKDKVAELFVNDAKYSTMIVNELKGKMTKGTIGLWVDIGTIGYFKDLKITLARP